MAARVERTASGASPQASFAALLQGAHGVVKIFCDSNTVIDGRDVSESLGLPLLAVMAIRFRHAIEFPGPAREGTNRKPIGAPPDRFSIFPALN